MSNDTRSRPMTAETIHTCSYYCERPECVRRQRDELRDRLEAALASAPPSAPEPEVHSYDPTDQRETVTIRWPDGKCLSYVLDRTRYTDNLPPIAPVGVEDIAVELERYADCPGSVLALLERSLAVIQHDIDEIGGCDHSVGICCCELIRLAEDIRAALAAQQQGQAVAECHCATCTCAPGMTPAVRFDTSPAAREGAIRDHLIALGWTPPGAQQPAPPSVPVGVDEMQRRLDREESDHARTIDQRDAAIDRARGEEAKT